VCGTVGECKEGGNDDGIPIIVHTPYFRSGDGCLDGCFGGVNGDERVMFASMEMFLEFSMAAFLVVAGKGSYFGFSDMEDPNDDYELGGWADSSWPYFPQYDTTRTGRPLSPPIITDNGRHYSREFEREDRVC